ncbi:MAG: DUF116 domain-containing protein [Calditrichaeota bacterium]|nr:MAG: DUF116 domain-containing protein [Calditrichota bacterium]
MDKKHPTYRLTEDFQKKLSSLTDDVIKKGYELFEKEFERIDSFVEQAVSDTSERTDHELRRTEKEKYLLELISYKIYDNLNREKFNRCKNTIIILPDCLSIHEYECQKTDEEYGNRCTECHPDCQSYQIMELAEKYGCPVYFSKRKLSEQLEHHARQMDGDTSVIGIACILMLANGMRAADDLGIPARGVLLNFCGCDHWNDEPFASEFQIEMLKSILEEKYGF